MKRVAPDPLNPSIQNNMTPFTSTLPAEITLLILRKLSSYTSIISVSLASKDLQALLSNFWPNLFQLYFEKSPNTTEVKQKFLYEYNRRFDVYRSTLIPFPPLDPAIRLISSSTAETLPISPGEEPLARGKVYEIKIDPIDRLSFQICQNKLVTYHYRHSSTELGKRTIEVVDLAHIENFTRTLLSAKIDTFLHLGVYQDKIVKLSIFELQLWNLTPWKREVTLDITPTLFEAANSNCAVSIFSHPSKFITITNQTCVAEWDLSTKRPIWFVRYSPNRRITASAIDGERVVIGDLHGRISIIDLTTKKQIHSIEAHTKCIDSVIVHNQTIYSSSESSDIKSWDLQTFAKKDSHQFSQMYHIILYVWDEKLVAKVLNRRSKEMIAALMDLDLKVTRKWRLLRHQALTPDSMLASYQGKLIAQTKEGIHICDYTLPEYVLKPLKAKE